MRAIVLKIKLPGKGLTQEISGDRGSCWWAPANTNEASLITMKFNKHLTLTLEISLNINSRNQPPTFYGPLVNWWPHLRVGFHCAKSCTIVYRKKNPVWSRYEEKGILITPVILVQYSAQLIWNTYWQDTSRGCAARGARCMRSNVYYAIPTFPGLPSFQVNQKIAKRITNTARRN